jgi:hypothetical protein
VEILDVGIGLGERLGCGPRFHQAQCRGQLMRLNWMAADNTEVKDALVAEKGRKDEGAKNTHRLAAARRRASH